MNFDFKQMLKKELNLGDKDIQIRKNIGIACVVISLIPGSVLMLLLGIALISSATLRWCPVYSGLQKSTCST
jgi:hypothetical protein